MAETSTIETLTAKSPDTPPQANSPNKYCAVICATSTAYCEGAGYALSMLVRFGNASSLWALLCTHYRDSVRYFLPLSILHAILVFAQSRISCRWTTPRTQIRCCFSSLPLDPNGPPGNAWGRFGTADQLGMLEVVSGVRISLDWPLNKPIYLP